MSFPNLRNKRTKKNKLSKLLEFHPMADTLENIEIPFKNKDLSYESYYSMDKIKIEYYYNSDIIGEI